MLNTAAFDAADSVALDRFFGDLPTIDHVMVTACRPYYGRLADMDFTKIRDLIGAHLLLALYVARNAANKSATGRNSDLHGRHWWSTPSDRHEHC